MDNLDIEENHLKCKGTHENIKISVKKKLAHGYHMAAKNTKFGYQIVHGKDQEAGCLQAQGLGK